MPGAAAAGGGRPPAASLPSPAPSRAARVAGITPGPPPAGLGLGLEAGHGSLPAGGAGGGRGVDPSRGAAGRAGPCLRLTRSGDSATPDPVDFHHLRGVPSRWDRDPLRIRRCG